MATTGAARLWSVSSGAEGLGGHGCEAQWGQQGSVLPSAATLLLRQPMPFSLLWGRGHCDFCHSRAAPSVAPPQLLWLRVQPCATSAGLPPVSPSLPLLGLGCRSPVTHALAAAAAAAILAALPAAGRSALAWGRGW